MGRRISDSDPNGKKPCAVCRTMRVVVIFAVMVVMLMAYANKLHWLEDIDFTSLFGYLVVVFFFTVLGYRVWDEYGRPKQSFAELEEKRVRREKQFDELDALEAERAAAEHAEAQLNEELSQETDNIDELKLDIETEIGAEPEPEPEQLDLLGFATQKKSEE
jgi:septal ring factor EnvC (AmiA/AmiB activator)